MALVTFAAVAYKNSDHQQIIEILNVNRCYFTSETGDGGSSDFEVSSHGPHLWNAMAEPLDEATKARCRSSDESGRSRVARRFLEACINDATPWMTIYNLKTYEMPTHLLHNIVKRWDACLSPTEDQLVECEFQLVAVETKGSDSGYDSSSLRLATWLAIGLRNMRLRQRLPEVQTVQGNGKNKLRPFAHIAAVGHMLSLHVASKGGRWNYGRLPITMLAASANPGPQLLI
ncbi:conserved hypothetical protein [Histoplasma capsulatum H143]|uniref:Uncharacterized protein n=1 Tax=Ajellomyces capsulatus (strain H143) TaxID=544712 RepID=C6HCQ3_AJECH|nr:conserved hypothetical protein [Histoplasma capsulatum H143]